MNRTLDLPRDVYRKLAQGAAERGMTVQSLLTVFSELVALPDQATEHDRERCERIDSLLERFRAGGLDADARAELDHLIDADYEAANVRADDLIRAKQRRASAGL